MRLCRLCTGLLVLTAALVVWGRSTGAQEVELPPPAPLPGPGAAVPPPVNIGKTLPRKERESPQATETGPTFPAGPPLVPATQGLEPLPPTNPLPETAPPRASGPMPMSVVGPAGNRETSVPGSETTPAPALVPVTERKAASPTVSAAPEAPAFRLVKPPQPPSLGTPQGVAPPSIVQVSKPAPLDLPKIPGPALAVEKITPPVGNPGQAVAYELVVRNIGSGPAFHVCLEDPLPPGARYQASIPLAESLQDRLLWELGRIEPGAEQRCKIEIQTTQPVASWPAVLVRFATGPALPPRRPPEPPVLPVAAQATPPGKVEGVAGPMPPVPPPALTGSLLDLKTAGPANAAVGEKVVIQIEIHNPGTSPVTNLVLHVHLPAGLEHQQGHEIEATLKAVGAGETRKIELPVQATRAGWQVNQVWVTQATHVLARSKTTLLVGQGGGLQVKQTAPRQAWLDRDVEYRVEIHNAGTAPAQNVRVNDFLPLGLEFVAAGEGGTYDPLTRIITWQLGAIPAGQARGLMIKFRARTAGEWTNRVVAQVPGGSPASAETIITVNGLAALVLEVSARENQVEVGGETVYEIRVLNRGSQAATGIELVSHLPSGLQPLNAEGPVPFRLQGQQVIFNPLPRLDAGAETRFKVRVRCQTPGDMRVRVQLTSEQQRVPIIQEESTQVQ